MNGRQLLELLARLPARVWLQGILGLIGFVVLAVLGFALQGTAVAGRPVRRPRAGAAVTDARRRQGDRRAVRDRRPAPRRRSL